MKRSESGLQQHVSYPNSDNLRNCLSHEQCKLNLPEDKKHGFELYFPIFDVDECTKREFWDRGVTGCNKALIYHDSAMDGWLFSKMNELQKACGIRENGDFDYKGVIYAEQKKPKFLPGFKEFNSIDLISSERLIQALKLEIPYG